MPRISVIIPTRDRKDTLERCLRSFADVETPRAHFEVIVVDDGSRSPVGPELAPFNNSMSVTCLRQFPSRGPAAARNLGAAQARGSLLIFIDDDCLATAAWMTAFEKADAAEADGRALLGGRIQNALPDNVFSAASQQLISYLYAYGVRAGAHFQFFCSNNMAIRAEAFRAMQGFDTAFATAAGEDRDLSHRFATSGGRLVYVPDAVVGHAHDLNPGTFLRQHFRYGRAARRFHHQRARRGDGRFRLEPIAFYLGMLRFPFSQGDERPARQSLLLLISQVAYLLGFVAELSAGRESRMASGARAR